MSAAVDTLSAEEKALLDQMQAEDASEPMQDTQQPAPSEPTSTHAEPADKPQQPTMVDKRALDEERARRRDLEQKLQAREVEQAKISERLTLLMEAAKQHVAQPQTPATPPAPAPKWDEDPAGFIKHGFESIAQRLQQQEQSFRSELDGLKQGTSQITQQQQQAAAVADLDAWGAAQEQQFRSQAPDYDAAMAHLRDARTNMMRLMGVPEHHIAQQIMTDVRGVANMARERGMNFGEMLYKLAEAQGYRKSDAAPATPAPAAPAANAAERLIRGQDMATTIGSTGAAPRGAPAAQTIAAMSDAEFARLYAEVGKDPTRMRALFGE